MCGGCGTRPSLDPWEVRVDGGTRRDLIRRAAEAQRLSGGRLQVRAFGHTGYASLNRTGSRVVHPDLDSLTARMRAECGPGVVDGVERESAGFVARALLGITS